MANVWEKQHSSRINVNANITMSASSQQTAAFGSQTRQIRVACVAQPAFIEIGANPTATSSSMQVPANTIDYITVNPGQKLAVLQAGTAGVISVTEMA